MEMNSGRILGWDETFVDEGSSKKYIVLEKGDYPFVVRDFKRGTYKGSAKIPQCPCAEVTLEVQTKNGTAEVKYNMPLYSTMQWKIANFFLAVGMRKHEDPVVMDFNGAIGRHGCGAFYNRPWTGNDGKEKFSNEVDELYEYNEVRLHELMVKAAPPATPVDEKMPWD